jgi:hypothetical protein
MSAQVYDWIRYASTVSPLIPLTCLFIYYKAQPRQNLVLAISLSISLIFDITGFVISDWFDPKLSSISNNLYFIVSFPVIMWFYHETLTNRSLQMLVRIFTIGFLLSAMIFTLRQGLTVMNFNTLTLSSILLTITSFFFVADLNLMDQKSFSRNAFHETNIILNTSLGLYHFVTIVMFAVSDYAFAHLSLEDAYYFWAFHNVVNVSKNIGITVAFYLSARRIHALAPYHKRQRFRS